MESNQIQICVGSRPGIETLRLLGSRGTMDILCVFCCSSKVARFTELSNLLKHVSTKTLASRLKELEADGILNRKVYNEIPPRVEYSMTEKGQKLTQAIMPLLQWVTQWVENKSQENECGSNCTPMRMPKSL